MKKIRKRNYYPIESNEKYLFLVINSKIYVHDKITLDDIKILDVKYKSEIISDYKNNRIIITTTKTEVYIFDYELNLLAKHDLKEETFTHLYNKETMEFYAIPYSIKHDHATLYKINANDLSITKKKPPTRMTYRLSHYNENTISLVETIIANSKAPYYLVTLDSDSFEVKNTVKLDIKRTLLDNLDSKYYYDYENGIYDFNNSKFISYRELGIGKGVMRMKKSNNKYYFFQRNYAYI